jgi:hypothetical protein
VGGRRPAAGQTTEIAQTFSRNEVVEPDHELISSGAPSLTWVGHATWMVRLGGQTILTDPEKLNPENYMR